MTNGKKLIAPLAYAVLLVSFAVTTLPQLVRLSMEAARLRGLPYEERRLRVGEQGFYSAVMQVRSTLAGDEPLALILNPDRRNIGLATFADYYLYPRRVQLYFSRAAYYADMRSGRPQAIAYMQYGHDPVLRRASYEQIRAEEIGHTFVARPLTPSQDGTSFIVPVVASGDGPAPDVYTSEAVITNPNAIEARVTFEMLPSRVRADVRLRPGETREWNDLVYQLFATMSVGWMRIHADAPIRIGVWFVNRGIRSATPLPAVDRAETRSASFDVPRGGNLWVVNPADSAVTITINGRTHRVDGLAYSRLDVSGTLRVESADPVFAFASWRDAAGRTLFAWPNR